MSHGAIEFSGQHLHLTPARHGVLAWTDQPFSSNATAIKLSGSNINVPSRAILLTPRSGQDVSGSVDATLCIQMIGQGSLKSAGSTSTFGPLGAGCGAQLQIAKTAVDDTVTVGDFAAFGITVTNVSGTTATGVTIDDTLPDGGLEWGIVSATDATKCSITPGAGGDVLHCDVGNLAPSASFTVTVRAEVGRDQCYETLTNTAFADASNAGEVQDDAEIDVECGAIQVDKFAKVPGEEDVQPVAGAGFTLFLEDEATPTRRRQAPTGWPASTRCR